MPKVSVLVAVYNAATYLPKSLDSLLSQTFGDIEIICIDDCSTDNSLDILNMYAARDSRFIVLHLTRNQGQAVARNEGIKVSTGELIAFCDSDDWMAPDCLEQAVAVFDAHPQTDCVLLHVKNYWPDRDAYSDYPMPYFEVLSGREAFEGSIDWSIHGWYIARREMYLSDPYDTTCMSYSDDNTTRIHYYKSREVRCCHGVFYYRNYADSVTKKPSVRRFDYLRANESMKRQLEQLGVEERIMCQYETIRMLVLVDCYMVYHCHGRSLSAADRRWALSELRRVWHTIDVSRLDPKVTRKFGYRHLHSWTLFRLQEWTYFTLRGLLGRNSTGVEGAAGR